MARDLFRQFRWDNRYINMARYIGSWSKDPSTKVGAVLVRPNNSVAATGFNGFPPGEDDSPHLYEDRAYKYEHVVHAEVNALDFFRDGSLTSEQPARGFALYTSFPVCPDCMERLVEEGITTVVCPTLQTKGKDAAWIAEWTKRMARALTIAERGGIAVRMFPCE